MTAKNALVRQNDAVFITGHGKLDVDAYFFNKTYFVADSLQLDVNKECENYISVIDIKQKATTNAHNFLTKTLKGEMRSTLLLPKELAIDVSSYAALSMSTPYIFVGDDARFETQEFENLFGVIQCSKDLTLTSHAKFINHGENETKQGIKVAGKVTLNFKAGENINNAPITAEQINFINISTLNNSNLIKANSGIEINEAKDFTNNEAGCIDAATLDIKKIQNLTNDGMIIAKNHFNLSNPHQLNNNKTGKIRAKSISIYTLKDVLPILQTTLNNEGSIFITERFLLDNGVKFENGIGAKVTSSPVL